MKFLSIFVLVLSTAAAFRLANTNTCNGNTKLGIANGEKAAIEQFPYQVFLAFQRSSIKRSYCGGSLLSGQWVLTAAHCAKPFEFVTVILGAVDRTKPEVQYTVMPKDVIVHADYNSNTKYNDIALIKIPHTNYSDNIQPVELPAIATCYNPYVGEKAIASGWGYTSTTNKTRPVDLQWATMKVIENADCDKIYKHIISSKLCVATTGGVSPCHGDSGGPLVLFGTFIQIGVIAAGESGGCLSGDPAIFMRVTHFLSWIKEKTGIGCHFNPNKINCCW